MGNFIITFNGSARFIAVSSICGVYMAGAGCGLISVTTGAVVDGNRGSARSPSGEPNGTFAAALPALFDASGLARLQGSIASQLDVDVFDLGPLSAGDRVVVDVSTNSILSRLDSMIGLFDAGENMFIQNDDSGSGVDSFLDEVVRYESGHYYLVVTNSTFANFSERTGTYEIDITVTRGGAAFRPAAQTIFLDFDGGTVTADNLGVSRVPPFDAGDIDERYAGDTGIIKLTAIERFKDAFAAFDVIVITSDDDVEPSPPFSTVLFGGPHPPDFQAFGISERVDQLNENQADMAVIFTETFAPFAFSAPPTTEELGIAIGNIGAHEAGHLLGLSHVGEGTDLMDAISPADTFLEIQVFKRSPLYASELFPIGFQDAVLLLGAIVGAV